jgi:hypothetical protein
MTDWEFKTPPMLEGYYQAFYLNEVYFDVGEKFVCASAMSYHIKSRKNNTNVI